jgi:hypothetical protein
MSIAIVCYGTVYQHTINTNNIYLLTVLSKIGEGKLGYLKPCAYFPEDKDIIDLLLRVATVNCDSIKTSSQKRREVSHK